MLPDILERLAPPLPQLGLPMGGRRAITFSDSRQGVARLAAKLQQDAERTLTRAFLYHAIQEGQGPSGEERARLEKMLKLFQTDPAEFAEAIANIEQQLSGEAKPIPWGDLINRFGAQQELGAFATKVWTERNWGGRDMADNPAKLAEMFLYRELFRRPRAFRHGGRWRRTGGAPRQIRLVQSLPAPRGQLARLPGKLRSRLPSMHSASRPQFWRGVPRPARRACAGARYVPPP